MLMLCDVWEGALDVEEDIMKDGGVVGMMIRLNDMNGGHHMDTNFYNQWAQAKNFLRAPYFVYNPWVDGLANFEWLDVHAPAETTIVFADIEVKKAGYPPEEYADEVEEFINLTRSQWRTAIYTGGWFLPILSHWPTGYYWWGRYPYYLCPQGDKVTWTWQTMQERMNVYGYHPDPTHLCPGDPVLWQCSGDKVILPGSAGRPMDVTGWPKTLVELEEFWGAKCPYTPDLCTRVQLLWDQALLHGWSLQ